MNDDASMLRLYAEKKSEAAFTSVVRRHVDLVYGAALRRTGGDPHLAADVTQQVFTALARNAGKLSRHTVLQAWLHTATRNASLNLVISENRRRIREARAIALEAPVSGGAAAPDWERIKPMLDEAIDALPETDRAAVLLRFFEHRDFSQIGVALKVSSDAARMRTERALERLRALLARRGVTSTAAALGAIVANQPLMSAPAGITSALVTAALAGNTAGAGLSTSLLTIMTTKTVSTAVITGVLALAAGTFLGRSGYAGRPEVVPQQAPETPVLAREIAALRQSNSALQAEIDRVDAANLQLNAANAQLNASNAKLAAEKAAPAAAQARNLSIGMTSRELKQSILSNLRQVDAARAQYKLENGADPASVEVLVGDNGYIRRLQTVGGEDYSGLSMAAGQILSVTAPDGTVVKYDPAGVDTTQVTDPMTDEERAQEQMQKVGPAVTQAVAAYRAANQGQNPPNPDALTPYFANPQDAAAFAQARDAMNAAHAPKH